MLLRVGIVMVLFAVASAVVAVVAVNLWGIGESAAPPEVPSEEPPEAPSREPSAGREVAELPVVPEDWPRPSGEEVSEARGPRYYAPDGSADLALTVEAIGLYDVPVISSSAEEALDRGVIHIPQTPMPWEERRQKNVYLAGHRLGYPGTGSRLVFYELDKLARGDAVILEDRSDNAYEYRVSEVFVVEPNDDWVVDPVRDRDMVTLQTCTMPDFENRLIVRADRV